MITRQLGQLILPLGIALMIGSFLGAAIIFLSPAQATAQGGDWPEINLVEIAAGLEKPTHITHAGDGSDRLFIVEQPGRIRLIKDGVLQSTPFLSITDRVYDERNEQGLLSVAFPPGYADKGYFYVNYTSISVGDKADGHTVVARYYVSNDPDIADPDSEEKILIIDQPDRNHNGGQLAFSPNDAYLYIGMGDGGGSNDPGNYSQRTDTLLGKMLRIDVESGETPYAIPATNPFTQTNAPDEIWALGLRNPWRFSFDRQTGDLYIGDVGQGAYEEIDFQPASSAGGENYGWKIMEGPECRPSTTCTPPANHVPPVAFYDHSQERGAVTGGFVYRGPAQELQGLYFYGDYLSGRIWGMRREGAAWQSHELTRTTYLITTFGEDEAGNLYLADRGGEIYRITTFLPDLTASTKDVVPATGEAGQTFTYTITLINSGPPLTQTTYLTDTLPAGLAYVPGSLEATFGMVNDAGPELLWQGLMNPTSTVQITYQVTATGLLTGALQNVAVVKTQNFDPYTLTKTILLGVVSREHYLPVIFKQPPG